MRISFGYLERMMMISMYHKGNRRVRLAEKWTEVETSSSSDCVALRKTEEACLQVTSDTFAEPVDRITKVSEAYLRHFRVK